MIYTIMHFTSSQQEVEFSKTKNRSEYTIKTYQPYKRTNSYTPKPEFNPITDVMIIPINSIAMSENEKIKRDNKNKKRLRKMKSDNKKWKVQLCIVDQTRVRHIWCEQACPIHDSHP